MSRLCERDGCWEPIETDNMRARWCSDACKVRASKDRRAQAAQAGRETPEKLRKPIRLLTQAERIERALILAGETGITQVDFDLPDVIDGGTPIKRVAARVQDLRDEGRNIVTRGRRKRCAIYILPTTTGAGAPAAAATPPAPDRHVSGPGRGGDASTDQLFTPKPAHHYDEVA